ncbi:MAG: choice-of-anchor B family protein [Gemmatimonadota bacterium]
MRVDALFGGSVVRHAASAAVLLAGALGAGPLAAGPLAAQSVGPSAPMESSANSLPGAVVVGFGSAVALLDGEVLVGRTEEFSVFAVPATRPGSIVVFRPDSETGEWTESGALTAESVSAGDGFGSVLAATQDLVVAGAPEHRNSRGTAIVFERSEEGEWVETDQLSYPGGERGDEFGAALAISGGEILVGSPGAAGGQGAVFVFSRAAGGGWAASGLVPTPVGEAGSRFGTAMVAGEDLLAVGAPGPVKYSLFGGGGDNKAGSVHVFGRSGSGRWRPVTGSGGLAAEGTLGLGTALVLGGGGILASAPLTDGSAGAIVNFGVDAEGNWAESGTFRADVPQPQARLGHALAMAGSQLLAGAPTEQGLRGAVHVFSQIPNGTWAETQALSVPVAGIIGFFGGSLAANEDMAIIGAPGTELFAGLAYRFVLAGDAKGFSELGSLADAGGGLEAITGEELKCEEGSASIFGCHEVDLVSYTPPADLGAARGIMVNDLWGWTDPETGIEYALVGRSDGMTFVDVSDPETPVYLGQLPLTEGATINLWRDVKVYANHAFIVADGAGQHGVQIFDLTQLRSVLEAPVTFEETAHYDGIASAHNIVVNEATGFAYVVGASGGGETCGGGLHMLDVRVPAQPVFAGCFSDPATGRASTGYSHDAQCVVYEGPDTEHAGREICFGANETGISIADVSDKSAPLALANAAYPNAGYVHQGWISHDHRYFFVNDELDEVAGTVDKTRTLVWDIDDLDDPVLETEYFGPTGASDHNLYVRGRYMYMSNYVSGLRIVDVADPSNPVEVGHFDTVPFGSDTPGFAGSWSNYPFFESGIILVSSMNEGLFVLRKRQEDLVP